MFEDSISISSMTDRLKKYVNNDNTDTIFDNDINSYSQWGTVQTHALENQNKQAYMETNSNYYVPTNTLNIGGAGYNGAPVQEKMSNGVYANVYPKIQQPIANQFNNAFVVPQFQFNYSFQQPQFMYVTPDTEQQKPRELDEKEIEKKIREMDKPVSYKAPIVVQKNTEEKLYSYGDIKRKNAELYKGNIDDGLPNHSPVNNNMKNVFSRNAGLSFGPNIDPCLVINVYNLVIAKYQECFYNKMARMEDLAGHPIVQDFIEVLNLNDPINDVIYPMLTIYQNRCRFKQYVDSGILQEQELNDYIHAILKATPQSFNPVRERNMLGEMAGAYNTIRKELNTKYNPIPGNMPKYVKPLNSITKALGINDVIDNSMRNSILSNSTPIYANEDNKIEMDDTSSITDIDRQRIKDQIKARGLDIRPGHIYSKTTNDLGIVPDDDIIPNGIPTYIPNSYNDQKAVTDNIIKNMESEKHDYTLEDNDSISPDEQENLRKRLTDEELAKLPEGTNLTPVVLNNIDKMVTEKMKQMGKFNTMNQFADNPYVTRNNVIPPSIEQENPLYSKYKVDDAFWEIAKLQCKTLHEAIHNEEYGFMDPKVDIATMLERCLNVGVPFYNNAGQEKPASVILMEYFTDIYNLGIVDQIPPMPKISGGVSEYIDKSTLMRYGLPTESIYYKNDYAINDINTVSSNVQMSNSITNNIMNAMPMQQPMMGLYQQPQIPMPNMMPMQQPTFYRPGIPMFSTPYSMPSYMNPMFNFGMYNNSYNRDMLSILISAEYNLKNRQMGASDLTALKIYKQIYIYNGMTEEEADEQINQMTGKKTESEPQRKILSEKQLMERNLLLSQMSVEMHYKTEDAYKQYKAMRGEPLPVLKPVMSPDYMFKTRYVNDPTISYSEFARRTNMMHYAELLSDNKRKAKYEGGQTFTNRKHLNPMLRQGYNPIYADNMAAMSLVGKPFPTHLDPYTKYADPRSNDDIKKVIYSKVTDYPDLLKRSEIPNDECLIEAISRAEKKQDQFYVDNKDIEEEEKEYIDKKSNNTDTDNKSKYGIKTDLKYLRRFNINVSEYEDFDNKTFDSLSGPSVYQILDEKTMQEISTIVRRDPSQPRKVKKIRKLIESRYPRFKYFNKGTNRFTFIDMCNNSYILKISITSEGKEATKSEFYTQKLLKPFCTRIFSMTPDGQFSTCERVERYEKDAYSERFDDLKYVLQEVMSRCVVDDAGLLTFNNWGIREGFGPVILDYAKCYKLVDKYIKCHQKNPDGTTCDGIMQYDTTYSYFRCPKCGRLITFGNTKGLEPITIQDLGATNFTIYHKYDQDTIKRITVVKGNNIILDTKQKSDKKGNYIKTSSLIEKSKKRKINIEDYY